MPDQAMDNAVQGDVQFDCPVQGLPLDFADKVRMKVPPSFAAPEPTLSPAEQRARRWMHRMDYLREEVAGHMLGITLVALMAVLGVIYTYRRELIQLLIHLKNHHH